LVGAIVLILPRNTPKCWLRNWVKVNSCKPVSGSTVGSIQAMLAGTMAPDSWRRVSSKLVTDWTLKKPPGHSPAFWVSTLSVRITLPQSALALSRPPLVIDCGIQ
jgi:hypothetical protein